MMIELVAPGLLVAAISSSAESSMPADLFQESQGLFTGALACTDGPLFVSQMLLLGSEARQRCSYFEENGYAKNLLNADVHALIADVKIVLLYIATGIVALPDEHASTVLPLAQLWNVPALVAEATRILLLCACRRSLSISVDSLITILVPSADSVQINAIATIALVQVEQEQQESAVWLTGPPSPFREALVVALTKMVSRISCLRGTLSLLATIRIPVWIFRA